MGLAAAVQVQRKIVVLVRDEGLAAQLQAQAVVYQRATGMGGSAGIAELGGLMEGVAAALLLPLFADARRRLRNLLLEAGRRGCLRVEAYGIV